MFFAERHCHVISVTLRNAGQDWPITVVRWLLGMDYLNIIVFKIGFVLLYIPVKNYKNEHAQNNMLPTLYTQ